MQAISYGNTRLVARRGTLMYDNYQTASSPVAPGFARLRSTDGTISTREELDIWKNRTTNIA